MAHIRIYNPEGMGKPLGLYGQITRVRASEWLFIAGQLATGGNGNIVGKGDFDAQMKQVFENIGIALESAGASFAEVVQLTTYLVHSQDIESFMRVREEIFPNLFPDGAFPPNTLLIVDRLVREEFLIEVQTIAGI